MNIKIVSSVVLALGIVILVVLVVLGAVVRQTISDTIIDRLIYEVPKGSEKADYEACYRDTVATFENEYYLWNLTNQADFLNGTKPHFDLVGPFSYAQWYCRYEYNLNESTGYLTYRTRYEGYFFLRDDSVSEDNVLITNINPAYLGILKQTSDSVLPYVFVPHILNAVIRTLSLPSTLTAVRQAGFPTVLAKMNADTTLAISRQNVAGLVTQFPIADFFDNNTTAIDGVQGWASYVYSINSTLNATIDPIAEQQIYDNLTNAAALAAFSLKTGATLSAEFNLTTELGQLLSDYVTYLFGTTAIVEDSASDVYNQWANGTTVNAPYPTNWGLGVASGISYDNVKTLFDTTNPCSLTSAAGIQQWLRVQAGASLQDLCPGNFTLSADQVQAISTWMTNYATIVVEPTLLSNYGITNWDDFAYAQWGMRVAGQSVRNMPGFDATAFATILSAITGINQQALLAITVQNNRLTFEPETQIASGDNFQNFQQAKGMLTGQYSLTNATNFLAFLGFLNSFNLAPLIERYGQRAGLVVSPFLIKAYVDPVFKGTIAESILQMIYSAGGGYVTTRTVRQWLFTAQDPLLPFLGNSPNAGLMNNLTRTKEQADALNKTYVPVFTGKNDLLWSLMPYNNGTNLTFWNGTVLITGYNGTQFLPNGYVDKKDKEYPLDLFHPLINRTIPFTNKAKLKWNGVNIRYLAVADDALLSADKNPDNYKYYSQYSGAINKSSNPPGLPVFLTTPNFLSAEPAFSANVTFSDTIFTDYKPDDPLSQHRLTQFILVEPLLGSTLWANLPIQVNFQYKPSAKFPNVNGGFAPIYWNAIGDKASTDNLETIKSSLYNGQRAWPALIGVGAAVGSVMIIAGIVGLIYYRKQKGIKL